MNKPLVIGLTGGIGSGKSEVARAFAARGIEIADADQAAHAVSAGGMAGFDAVVATFGDDVIGEDGELDRPWLRRRVFADAQARTCLESILHPLIGDYLAHEIDGWSGAYGILSVPLLLERGGLRSRVARVLVVDCPEDEQVRRVVTRSGLSPDDVRAIMATQMTRDARLSGADDIVDNGGSMANLAPQVARLDAFYREFAARRSAGEAIRA